MLSSFLIIEKNILRLGRVTAWQWKTGTRPQNLGLGIPDVTLPSVAGAAVSEGMPVKIAITALPSPNSGGMVPMLWERMEIAGPDIYG